MWDVSERFLQALRGPHTIVTRADVYFGGILVMSNLPVEGGTVSIDENSQVRRTASLTVSDPELDPSSIIDILAPFGTEVVLRRGIDFGGEEELIPLGVFRIDRATRGSWFDGVSLECSDRSMAVQEARFVKPWNTYAGTEIRAEIEAMVRDVLPNIEFYDLTDDASTTSAGLWERDRWEAIEKLSASIGAELVFDPLGRAVLRPIPDEQDDPVWTVDAGEWGVMLDVETGVSRENVYNAIVAIGENTDNTPSIVGYAYVGTGPLAWGGPFGKKPRFFTSQYITTLDQALKAARGILARSAGFQRTVNPTSIVNPALDVGDTIIVSLPDGQEYKQVIRSLSIPLTAEEAQPIGTRLVEGTIALEGTLD